MDAYKIFQSNKKTLKLLLMVLSIMVIMTALVGCGGNEANTPAGDTGSANTGADAPDAADDAGDAEEFIYFGVNYELTGAFPIIGESAIQGIDMAVDEINAAGGIVIDGKAYTLACDQYVYSLPAIEELLSDKIPSSVPYEEDFAADLTPEFTISAMMKADRDAKRRLAQKGQSSRPRPGASPRGKRQARRGKDSRP